MAKKNELNVDLYDILMDEDNNEPIVLFDEDGNKVEFEQVAIVPYQEKIYAILKPIDEMEGVSDDEAIPFRLEKNERGETVVVIEESDEIGEKVFEIYYKLLDEEEGNVAEDQQDDVQEKSESGADDKK